MDNGEHDTERRLLEHHRSRLRRFAEERRRLEVQERASRLIVEGLELELGETVTIEDSIEVDHTSRPQNPEESQEPSGATSRPSPANGATVNPEQVVQALTARSAAKRVMAERGGGWRSHDLVQETVRRGWKIDAQRKEDAFRTALLRMERDGEAVRIDRGLYALANDPLAVNGAQTEGGGDED